ncbi:uncharacterized protein LODBEIA_P52940 [Lodderomyces beijingensis]|uniref:SWR1-complex protein 5 n=1 Tax=Lodderomyces beijingensis TaxID=1775926 RepID=A0ABP0ZWC2_9ASCO
MSPPDESLRQDAEKKSSQEPMSKEEEEAEGSLKATDAITDESEDDEDYDPTKKYDNIEEESADEDDDEDGGLKADQQEIPDYSKVTSNISQVKTRSQRLHEKEVKRSKYIGKFQTDTSGLVKDTCSLDIESIFAELKQGKITPEVETQDSEQAPSVSVSNNSSSNAGVQPANQDKSDKKVQIQIHYSFAGKLITESKEVDEDSEEAKAYLNSTSSITSNSNDVPNKRSQVEITRTDPHTQQPLQLRIKLKRPSLIDKMLQLSSKKSKLSTLEKSRLDWASFIDKRKIGDELKKHNKAGYLDKQDFLGRMDLKKDEIYLKAKQDDRRRQFQLQNK